VPDIDAVEPTRCEPRAGPRCLTRCCR
jgi:hypothetical protein